MTHAYNRVYLADAEVCLANAFDYAVYDCAVSGSMFAHAFVQSGLAQQFERGNPRVVAGMSGLDVACEALGYCGLLDEESNPTYGRGLSPEYWAGQMLARYQWERGCCFADVFARVSFERVADLYYPLHEADSSVFIDQLDQLLVESKPPQTNLARLRTLHGLSQSELAHASGVGLKSIQAYEQRVNSLNKASGQSLRRLAMTLGCSIENLLEFEPQVAAEYLPQAR
ncbi:MAG: helix-turn-helix domain-containing protein [Atopobiaceae bacterium]|jgi:DNA-binding transcriptional regulator YiaG|nr:helix-turn-helix domain-containing protein [Atopobiaceae bacterium]